MRQDTRVHRTPHPCWRGLLLLLLVFFCMWHQVSAAVCLLQQQPRCYCTYLSAFRRPIGPIGQPWADKCLLHSVQQPVLLYVTCVRILAEQPRCYCAYLSGFRRPIGPIGQPWADKCLLHSIQLSVLLYVTCVRMLCFMCVRPLGAIYLLCRVFMCPYYICYVPIYCHVPVRYLTVRTTVCPYSIPPHAECVQTVRPLYTYYHIYIYICIYIYIILYF